MPKYIEISLSEMEDFVSLITKGNYKKYRVGNELVFGYHLKHNKDLILCIYSSLDYEGNFSRESGRDSIKVILYSTKEGKNIGGRSRINRTENWKIRLKEKFLDVGKKVKYYECSCGGYFVIRKSKASGKTFLGCSRYPECTKKKQSYF